jgi:hypothetical protein
MSTEDSDHRLEADLESRIDSAREDIQKRIERLPGDITGHDRVGKWRATLAEFHAMLDDKERFPAPSAGDLILSWVCPPDKLEALLGDLREICAKRAKTHGVRSARLMYWWHVTRTTGFYLLGALMRVLKILMLVEALRKML